jgi:DNA-directed RNA polymerase specialized sigma24 family protein
MNYAQRKEPRKSKHKLRNKMHELVNELIMQIAEENEGEELLLRDLRAEAMLRLERSAITPSDFKILTNAWDLKESNRRKKNEKYTVSLNSFIKAADAGDSDEIDMFVCTDAVFPIPFCYTLRTRYWRQIINGDFIDYIHDCAYEMHNCATEKDVSEAIKQLTNNQKEIFYMIVVEGKSPQRIAAFRNQTPRNINKT